METSSQSRLRAHPAERFAGPEHVFDLERIFETLQREAPEGQHGHRQITVLRHGQVTMVALAFEAGATLADHAAKGLVTIHVLDGALTVSTPQNSHELTGGAVLVLWPNVRHSVTATVPSAILLTVHLESNQ